MKSTISGHSQVAKYQAPSTVVIFRSHWSLGLTVVERDSPTNATGPAVAPRRAPRSRASGLPEQSSATSTPTPSVSSRSCSTMSGSRASSTSSAPRPRAYAMRESSTSSAMTRAPRALPTRIAAPPMGPVPNTAMVSVPEVSSRFWMLYWVPIMSVATQAASKLMESGTGMQLTAGTTISSASPPSKSKPMHCPVGAQHPVAAEAPAAVAAADGEVDGHPVALAERGVGVRAQPCDLAGRLVARHDGARARRRAAHHGGAVVQRHVAAAQRGRAHPDERLARAGHRVVPLHHAHLAGSGQQHGLHDGTSIPTTRHG